MGGFPFLSVVLLVGAGVTATLGALAHWRRDTPGAPAFALLAGSMSLYSAVYAFSIPFAYGQFRIVLDAVQWLGIAFLPVAWLLFALEYSGRPELMRREIVASLCIIPALAIIAVFAWAMPVPDSSLLATFGDLFYTSTETTQWMGHTFVSHDPGAIYLLYIGFAYLCFLSGVGILFEFIVRFDHLYQNQAVSIVLGGLAPWMGNVIAILGHEPVPGLDMLPFLVPISGILFANAVFRHELFDFTPATRRKGEATLVEEMRDAIVVVDDADRIVNVNAAACTTFQLDKKTALGSPMTHELGVDVPDGDDRFEIQHDGSVYEVTSSPVHDRYDSLIGRTLAFRDITAHRDDEQRLSVLNRVLRHNLRTEVNVISGYASMAERELPESKDDIASEITTAANTLDELGQKAREVERIMARDSTATGEHALADQIADGVDRVQANHPELEVTVDVPSDVTIRIDAVVFEAVVRDLLGSLAHHGSTGSTVRLDAIVDGDDVHLRVQDAGAGIPKTEYEVVRSGEETPLDHASGLSLWLVRWGARQLDGTLSFEPGDGDVVLEIPDCVVSAPPTAASVDAATARDWSSAVVTSDTAEPDTGPLADGGDDTDDDDGRTD